MVRAGAARTRPRGLGWDPRETVRYDPAEHRDYHGRWGSGGAPRLATGGTPPERGILAGRQIEREWRFAEDPEVKAELAAAMTSHKNGDAAAAAAHLRAAADLAAKSDSKNTSPGDLRKLADYIAKPGHRRAPPHPAGGGPHKGKPSRWTSDSLHAELGKSDVDDRAHQALQRAAEAYDNGDWDRAVDNLDAAAADVMTTAQGGSRERAAGLRNLAEGIVLDHPGGDRRVVGRLRTELAVEQKLAASGETAGNLALTLGQIRRKDYMRAIGSLRTAAYTADAAGDHTAEARLSAMADRLEAVEGKNAKLARSVTTFAAKGAGAVPGLLGGGRQAWDGTVEVLDDIPGHSSLGVTLADINWAGHMRVKTSVARGIADDLAGTGEITAMDSFSVPLHEEIHSVIGGAWARQRAAQQAAHAGSGRSPDDDAVLGRFAALDAASADGGPAAGQAAHVYTAPQINGTDWGNAVQAEAALKTTRATIASLERRGFLEWDGTSSTVYEPGKTPAPAERNYRRTSKAVATDPPSPADRGPQIGDGSAPYQQPPVQAIEEGFTELGTIQHAAGYFTKTGIGRRETPMLAQRPAGTADPVAKAKVLASVAGLAKTASPAERAQWGEVAAQIRADRQPLAQRYLTGILDGIPAYNPRWKAVISVKGDLAQAFDTRTMDNPAYKAKLAALRKRLDDERTKITLRMSEPIPPGGARPDRVYSTASLDEARRAVTRAIGDLQGRDDFPVAPEDVFEELGRIGHLGDTELGDDAHEIAAALNDLMRTHTLKHTTMAQYAARLDDRDRIVAGDAWGHYGEETKQALLWCEEVAKAEGLKGPAIEARVHELADEINAEGPAGKLAVMTSQVERLPDVKGTWGRSAMLAQIRDTWLSDGAIAAFTGAHVRGKNMQHHQQGGRS